MPLSSSYYERNSNIELLRIISMLMIVAHHYVHYGVEQNYNPAIAGIVFSSGTMLNKLLSVFLLPGGVVGVAVFFMISGYFGIKNSRVNIAKIVLSVFTYSIGGVIVAGLILFFGGNLQLNNELIKTICVYMFPINTGTYWFVTTYLFLMTIKPFLNKIISSINYKNHLVLISFLLLEYAVGRKLLTNYFSVLEAILYYLIGAFLEKYRTDISIKRTISFLMFVIGWGGYMVFVHIGIPCFDIIGICLMGTVSAIGIFSFFTFSNADSNKLINIVGSLTFDVYLVHEHPLLREFLWHDLLQVQNQFMSNYYFFFALSSIVIVFVLCSIWAFIIQKLFLSRITTILNTFLKARGIR